MNGPSRQATKAASVLLEKWEVRGAEGPAHCAAIAELIDRTTDLPEILADNDRLREIWRGTLRAAEELRRQNERLRASAERARRWILQVTAKHEAPLRRLDLHEGRSVLTALAASHRESRGDGSEGPTLPRRILQRPTQN